MYSITCFAWGINLTPGASENPSLNEALQSAYSDDVHVIFEHVAGFCSHYSGDSDMPIWLGVEISEVDEWDAKAMAKAFKTYDLNPPTQKMLEDLETTRRAVLEALTENFNNDVTDECWEAYSVYLEYIRTAQGEYFTVHATS